MNVQYIKAALNDKLEVSVYQGHFATRHSHNSHYIDITRMKHEHTMAREAAVTLAQRYAYTSPIDTIVCMDGSEVIGAFLARHLANKDRFNVNSDKNINVVTPEFDHTGQMIFRDNAIGQFQHLSCRLGVKGSGMLVQKQQLGLVHGGHQQRHSLALTAREQTYLGRQTVF